MLQLAIQHHPKRARHLKTLTSLLDLDNVSEFCVIEDTVNSASGMRKCFQSVRFPGHLIVLQDDVIPCDNLISTCHQLIKAVPDHLISLYSDNPNVSIAISQKKHWLTINTAWGLCGYIIPTWMAASYLETEPRLPDVYADDVKLSIFLRHIKERVWVTCPSLIEHIGVETSQGFTHVSKPRVSNYFIGLEHSGLEVNWLDTAHLEITLATDTRRRLV